MIEGPVGASLLVGIEDGIAVTILNRPTQHNALSRQLRMNLVTALRSDERVGVTQ